MGMENWARGCSTFPTMIDLYFMPRNYDCMRRNRYGTNTSPNFRGKDHFHNENYFDCVFPPSLRFTILELWTLIFYILLSFRFFVWSLYCSDVDIAFSGTARSTHLVTEIGTKMISTWRLLSFLWSGERFPLVYTVYWAGQMQRRNKLCWPWSCFCLAVSAMRYCELGPKLILNPSNAIIGSQWCLKLCVASLYFRLTDRSTHMQRISRILWWFIVLTFVAVLLSTLLECRPLSRSWEYDPSHQSQSFVALNNSSAYLWPVSCQKGLSNLLTMAICNIVTDVALILLPIPVLWRMRLSTAKSVAISPSWVAFANDATLLEKYSWF